MVERVLSFEGFRLNWIRYFGNCDWKVLNKPEFAILPNNLGIFIIKIIVYTYLLYGITSNEKEIFQRSQKSYKINSKH